MVPMFQYVFLFIGSQEFLFNWFNGPLVYWSIGPMVRWSTGPLVHWSIGPLVHWFIGPLVHWSIGPLVHWSIGPTFVGAYLWCSSGHFSTAGALLRTRLVYREFPQLIGLRCYLHPMMVLLVFRKLVRGRFAELMIC